MTGSEQWLALVGTYQGMKSVSGLDVSHDYDGLPLDSRVAVLETSVRMLLLPDSYNDVLEFVSGLPSFEEAARWMNEPGPYTDSRTEAMQALTETKLVVALDYYFSVGALAAFRIGPVNLHLGESHSPVAGVAGSEMGLATTPDGSDMAIASTTVGVFNHLAANPKSSFADAAGDVSQRTGVSRSQVEVRSRGMSAHA